MKYISRFLTDCLNDLLDGFNWLTYQMDVTQWGILAAVFVICGFMALKTRI